VKEEKNLEIGEEYRIEFEDCCVNGELKVGKFLHYLVLRNEEYHVEYERPEEDTFWDAVFEAGRIGPEWGRWKPVLLRQ